MEEALQETKALPDEIIVVIGTPRSGTSMTAGLIHRHGAWAGTCKAPDQYNPKGHWENTVLRRMLKEWHKLIVHKGIIAKPVQGWREAITDALWDDGYRGGPLMVKHSALYSPIWFEFNPYFVTCWRDPTSIVRSCRRSRLFGRGDWTDDHYLKNITLHQNVMRRLWYHNPSRVFPVHTQELACGEYDLIKRAINGVGLKFDKSICDEFVSREHWHFSSEPLVVRESRN